VASAGCTPALRKVEKGTDILRQGDRPHVTVMVRSGMLARYHTMPSGDRQYLSLHVAGDLPDLQSLFLGITSNGGRSAVARVAHLSAGNLLARGRSDRCRAGLVRFH
jgi:CRP-like cAMP-binding protein